MVWRKFMERNGNLWSYPYFEEENKAAKESFHPIVCLLSEPAIIHRIKQEKAQVINEIRKRVNKWLTPKQWWLILSLIVSISINQVEQRSNSIMHFIIQSVKNQLPCPWSWNIKRCPRREQTIKIFSNILYSW